MNPAIFDRPSGAGALLGPGDIATPTAGYSLRYLSINYIGQPVVRVRKDVVGSPEQDFTPNQLTDGTLATFLGANDGFVSKWYDQFGSNDATNSTAAEQPKIWDASTGLVTGNGKPAVEFDGTDDILQSNRLLSTNTWFISSVVKKKDLIGTESLVGQHPGSAVTDRVNFVQYTDADIQMFFNNGTSYFNSHSTSATTNVTLITSRAISNDYFLSVNGIEEEIITNQTLTPLNTNFNIGALGNNSNNYEGLISEIIIYNTDQSANRTNIENNINAYYNIY